jgi:NADH-quinone oxidoreductase subunit L
MLRKFMPITAGTFIVGWLAIAGIPPFAGFWSKDEILLSAFNAFGGLGKVLWAVGFLTAMLTAYYMTRQVVMVFFGKNNWNAQLDATGDGHAADAHDAPAHDAPAGVQGLFGSAEAHVHAEPHESPWLMLTPLVVLAGLSVVGGLINLPGTGIGKRLEHWLEPVVGEAERKVTVGSSTKWGLAILTTVACVVAIGAAYAVYQRQKAKAVEPALLAHGWRYDEAVSAFMGGPGLAGFQAVADADAVGVDGAVNGTATLIAGLGGVFRRLQTGLVRNYAVGVGLGAVALLAWFVTRGVF